MRKPLFYSAGRNHPPDLKQEIDVLTLRFAIVCTSFRLCNLSLPRYGLAIAAGSDGSSAAAQVVHAALPFYINSPLFSISTRFLAYAKAGDLGP